jgi:hypothetical protein
MTLPWKPQTSLLSSSVRVQPAFFLIHTRLNMYVGGSKGSISGNYAMARPELHHIGTRAVCQSDCSGIGYPKVKHVININADVDDVSALQQDDASGR